MTPDHLVDQLPDHDDLALQLVAKERHGQIYREGYFPDRDRQYTQDQLALAAVCYAIPPKYRHDTAAPGYWPSDWDPTHWKPGERKQELVKAAALLIAELSRMLREEDGDSITVRLDPSPPAPALPIEVSEPAPSQFSGWVIEDRNAKVWLTLDSMGMPDWTTNKDQALCVALKEHADLFAQDAIAQLEVVPHIPLNPRTGKPYFTVPPDGWGTGWMAGEPRLLAALEESIDREASYQLVIRHMLGQPWDTSCVMVQEHEPWKLFDGLTGAAGMPPVSDPEGRAVFAAKLSRLTPRMGYNHAEGLAIEVLQTCGPSEVGV